MTKEPDEETLRLREAFVKKWEGAERIPQRDAPNAVAVIPYNKNCKWVPHILTLLPHSSSVGISTPIHFSP